MRHLLLFMLSAASFAVCSQTVSNLQPNATNSPQVPSVAASAVEGANPLLGLPPLPVPADNPQTSAKIALGDKLFHDKRFSMDGTVSCANCHDDGKAFTDNLPVSVGNHGLTGTRNAPTVINAAFNKSQFWDGREPDLESQSKQPFLNPVEGGLSQSSADTGYRPQRPRLPIGL